MHPYDRQCGKEARERARHGERRRVAHERPRSEHAEHRQRGERCERHVRAGDEQATEEQQRRELRSEDRRPRQRLGHQDPEVQLIRKQRLAGQAHRGRDEPHRNRHQERVIGEDGLLIGVVRPGRKVGVLCHEDAHQEATERQRHGEAAEHRPFQRLRAVVRQETEVEKRREEVAREDDLGSVAHVRLLRSCR